MPSAVIRSTVCPGTSTGGMMGAGGGGNGAGAGAGCDCASRIEPASNGTATSAAQAASRPDVILRISFLPFFGSPSSETFAIALAKARLLVELHLRLAEPDHVRRRHRDRSVDAEHRDL